LNGKRFRTGFNSPAAHLPFRAGMDDMLFLLELKIKSGLAGALLYVPKKYKKYKKKNALQTTYKV